MTPNRRAERNEDEGIPPSPKGVSTIQDRIAAFAMLDSMKERTQAEKSLRLSLVGFTNSEIAAMLQTSPAVVSNNLYVERKKATRRPPRESRP
jgi:hypothetical protein